MKNYRRGSQPEIGDKIGMFTVVGESESRKNNRPTWCLQCICGNIVLKPTSDVNKMVETSNCGCAGMHKSVKALNIGDKFGKLTVKAASHSDMHGKQIWLCKCECGDECYMNTSNLRKGKLPSCGCHVYTKHGGSYTRLYSVWTGMKDRCNNPCNDYYDYYGGRGISVCPEWENFSVFQEDMGDPPSGYVLDRIDTNSGYCKENCRWVTRSESSYNTRKQRNNTSGRTGVTYNTRYGTWSARIDYCGESICLGTSDTFEGACELRIAAELQYFGYLKE